MTSLLSDRVSRTAPPLVLLLLIAVSACRPHDPSTEPGAEDSPTPNDAAAEPWLFIEHEDPAPEPGDHAAPSRMIAGPDGDGDGVPDQFDACPQHPEDLDGFEDEDGCPEPDNDLDGIPDVDDQCPMEPEIFDGRQDDDGCPG